MVVVVVVAGSLVVCVDISVGLVVDDCGREALDNMFVVVV
jgi:hypothetical protein